MRKQMVEKQILQTGMNQLYSYPNNRAQLIADQAVLTTAALNSCYSKVNTLVTHALVLHSSPRANSYYTYISLKNV